MRLRDGLTSCLVYFYPITTWRQDQDLTARHEPGTNQARVSMAMAKIVGCPCPSFVSFVLHVCVHGYGCHGSRLP